MWRLVEDSDGQKGWVHQATLYGSRTFVIPGLPPEGVKAQNGEASAQEGDHIGKADARILARVATQDEARAHKNDVLLMSHPEEDSTVIAVLQQERWATSSCAPELPVVPCECEGLRGLAAPPSFWGCSRVRRFNQTDFSIEDAVYDIEFPLPPHADRRDSWAGLILTRDDPFPGAGGRECLPAQFLPRRA